MSETLRPMTLGEILDRTVQLYRRNFLSFAGISAVPTAAMLIVLLPAIGLLVIPGIASRQNAPMTGALVALLILVVIVAIVVAIAATVFSQTALIRAAISAYTGHTMRIREAFSAVRPLFWRYLWAIILQATWVGIIPAAIAGIVIAILLALAQAAGGGVGAGAAAGFLAFIIGAAAAVIIILRLLTFSLMMPACVAEGRPAWESLQRSKKLSHGTRGRIFLMFLLIWALSVVVSMIGYIPSMIIAVLAATVSKGGAAMAALLVVSQIINVLVNFAMQALITPVYMTALVLFYYDQRIRTEGYDIEWMMQQAGLEGSTPQILPDTASGPAPDAGTLNG